jgi:DNA-binding MarR family transcriptional regulator
VNIEEGTYMHDDSLERPFHSVGRDWAAGDVDLAGVELARLVRMVSQRYQAIADEHLHDSDVSGPRWAILMRLRGEESHGHADCSPTHLSRCQNVSKNTISSLIAGLEEQGLVERALDPDDRRGFRIRLSAAGRKLVTDTAPLHLRFMNQLVSDLSPEERTRLAELLQKLHRSLVAHGVRPAGARAADGGAADGRAADGRAADGRAEDGRAEDGGAEAESAR